MSLGHAIRLDLPLDEAVRAVARAELTEAARQLRQADDPDEGVHEARKALKRVRALLRLVRSGMDDDVRSSANTRLRDLGRQLSDVRDAVVLVETLDALRERHADALSPGAFDGLRAVLVTEHEVLRERQLAEVGAVAEVAGALEALAGEVDGWQVDGDDVLRDGVKRTAKRGRKRLDGVRDDASPDALHELRKRVKDLRYHVEVLAPAWPAVLEPYAEVLHELTDLLGDDHDLHVLFEAAAARPDAFTNGAEQQVLLDLVAVDRRGLQEHAVPLARRVYAERPKTLGKRLAGYVEVARDR